MSTRGKTQLLIICLLLINWRLAGQINVLDSLLHQLSWRTYKLHIPASYDGTASFPLVIALHGGGHTADTLIYMTEFNIKADNSDFIVVYPNGKKILVQTWNAGKCCGGAVTNDIDDVGFIVKMIDDLKSSYNIDLNRVYVTGASNGGMLAYRLACERPDLIAAIAPVATTMVTTLPCNPTRAVPVLHIHSLPDTQVPYNGGYGTGYAQTYMPPVDSVIGVWAANDSCTGPLDIVYNNGGAIGKKWTNCSSCSEVLIYTASDGGHSWPGGNKTANGDPVSIQLNATDLIWDFFSRHSLICSPASIYKNIEIDDKLLIFPNPADKIINVNCETGYSIFNCLGTLLKWSFESTREIFIGDLSPGYYIIRTDNKRGFFIKN